MLPYRTGKSALSGKDVFISGAWHGKGSRFISQDELKDLKPAPLHIDEIKDMDSLLEAVQDRLYFCGNKLFGTNRNIELADNCNDSLDVYFSHNIHNSRSVAFSAYMRDDEHIYGSMGIPSSSHAVRCVEGMHLQRAFEAHFSSKCSDIYYSFNCTGCSNVMFSFHQKGKSHMIGNLQLTKDRYLALKRKLASEMAEKLARDKKLFSIADLASMGLPPSAKKDTVADWGPAPNEVEAAFSKTTSLVLGKEYGGVARFGPWLGSRAFGFQKIIGARGTPTYRSDFPILMNIPGQRILKLEEALATAGERIELTEGESPGLEEIAKRTGKKMFFTFEFIDGVAVKMVDSPASFNGSYGYRCVDLTDSSYAAFSSAVTGNSKYVFGGGMRVLNSEFVINCFDPVNVSTSFESDGVMKSSGCYFCHNCENVRDSLFCFNAKGLKHAVGNQDVGREEFQRIKRILLDYVNSELEKKQGLGFGVFDIPKKIKDQV
ncbi:MAG: hypothetical protein ACP5NX_02760 [Candidatus Bilamarchaeaceae archaeon]